MIVFGAQLRAARALLGWTRADLAKAAGLHRNAVAYWEAKTEIPAGPYCEPVACRRIREAFRNAGVEVFSHPYVGVRSCRGPNSCTSTRGRARARHGVIRTKPSHGGPAASKTVPDDNVGRSQPRRCGARTRLGRPCIRKALTNGRCPNHGGLSTGPKTEAGRQRISHVQKRRWAASRSAGTQAEVRSE
jgi:DNA-binding XRE family transcriptional regulator